MKKLMVTFTGILILILLTTTVIASETVTVTENKDIYFSFDGNDTVCFDEVTGKYLYPVSYRDRTYVPLRFLCNFTGLGVEWIEETKTVALSSSGEKSTDFSALGSDSGRNEIIVTVDDEINFTWNGEKFNIVDPVNNLPVYAIMHNDRTFIPARFIAEKAGFQVGWDEETQKITITSPKLSKTEENVPVIDEPSETTPYHVMVSFSEQTLDWIENSLELDPHELFNRNFFTYYEKMQNGEKVPDSFYKLIITLNINFDYAEHFLPAAIENSNGYTNAFGKIIVIHSNPGEEQSDSMSNVTDHYLEIDKMAGYEDVFKINAMSEGTFAEPYFINGRADIMNFESTVINYVNEHIMN